MHRDHLGRLYPGKHLLGGGGGVCLTSLCYNGTHCTYCQRERQQADLSYSYCLPLCTAVRHCNGFISSVKNLVLSGE